MTGRALPEWRGRTADTPVPPRVRRRVFDAYGGRCYLSGREILPGDIFQIEHIKALSLGGENREANLAPVLVEPHKEKTRRDVAMKAKIARLRNRHLGIKPKKRPMWGSRASGWRKRMDGTVERRVP